MGADQHAGARQLAILTYHRIGQPEHGPPGIISATPNDFEEQLRPPAGSGRAISPAALLAARAGGAPLPRHPVLVTFDDAYADFGLEAWPVLRRLGVPVTLFVPTAFP